MTPRRPARREPTRPTLVSNGLVTPDATPEKKRIVDWTPQTPAKRLRFEDYRDSPDPIELSPPSPTSPSKRARHDDSPTALDRDAQSSVYTRAISLFQRGTTYRRIIGREPERDKIYRFIGEKILSRTRGALYLSGLPGTGKSALLTEVISSLTAAVPMEFRPKVAIVNCMIADKAENIFKIILDEITGKGKNIGTEAAISALQELFFDKDVTCKRHVVVLDELDHIVTTDQEVLFRMFQWAFGSSSNLVLVGIANALDLTDRFLPRLRSQKLLPEVLTFKPYTAEDVVKIIQERLLSLYEDESKRTLGEVPLMHPAAIQFCAKKIAKTTGDLRKAFDVCSLGLEKVAQETPLEESQNLSTAPKVKPNHIAQVCSTAFGESATIRIRRLNLQQKAVLCILVAYEREGTTHTTTSSSPSVSSMSNSITVTRLFERYSTQCHREKLFARLSLNEFYEVVSALESSGLISVAGLCGRKGMGTGGSKRVSKGGSGAAQGGSILGYREDYGQRRIASNTHTKDVAAAVSDIPILRPFF